MSDNHHEHRRVLSEDQLAPVLPGATQLLVTRWLIFFEQNLRLCWRFYCILGLFFSLVWLGLFALLPALLHLFLLALFTTALLQSLWDTGAGWRLPPVTIAARRLEAANALPHFPYEALTAKLVEPHPNQALKTLWQTHQARARAALVQLRLPRPQFTIAGEDRYALHLVVAGLLVIALIVGREDGVGRLQHALLLENIPSQETTTKLTAWITPPTYTGLPPLMLAEAGKPPRQELPAIPAGSKLAIRVAESDDLPHLVIDTAKIPFISAGEQSYALDSEIPATRHIKIKAGWSTLAQWPVTLTPDQPPQVVWDAAPQLERQEVQLSYHASDDYGLSAVQLVMQLAVSAPGVPTETQIIPLPGAGQKKFSGNPSLPLGMNIWSGLPVTLVIEASDQAEQVGQSAGVTITLPEHHFTDPLAQQLAAMRRDLLLDPAAQWKPTTNLLVSLAQQPEAYHGDPRILLGLRSTAVRMYLDRTQAHLTTIATTLWQMALALDDGGVTEAIERLQTAQRALEQAIANKADPATLQEKTAQLQQALLDYMESLARNLPAEAQDIPPDMLEEAGKNMVENLMQKMREIQDLTQTGAQEAAAQKLQELQKMLQDMQQAKPMNEEQKAEMQNLKELRGLIKQQEKLQEQTGQALQQPLPHQAEDLTKQQDALREQLGKIIGDMATTQSATPPQMTTADQGMKESGQQLRQEAWQPAQSAQGKTLQALKELAAQMKQKLQSQMMVFPSGGQGAEKQRNPFGDDKDNGTSLSGDVKVPDQQEIQRSRKILDELRRRSGEYNRPKEERGYIDRLLNPF